MLKNKLALMLMVICILLVVYFFSILIIIATGSIWGDEMIAKEVEIITFGSESNEIKIMKILNWTRDNVEYTADKIFFFKYPFWNIRDESNPYWMYLTKFGGCGERAALSKYMIEKIGTKSRKVNNPGEDHAWAEVYMNGSWIHADSGTPFNDPRVYERYEGGWKKNISYVYWIDENGTFHDVTKRYTDVGLLVIRVLNEKDIPVDGARIIVKSHSLMNPPHNRSKPITALIEKTNNFGTYKAELGGNNYTIIAEKDVLPFIAFSGTGNCTLIENDTCQIIIKLDENISLTEDGYIVLLIIFFAFLIIILIKLPSILEKLVDYLIKRYNIDRGHIFMLKINVKNMGILEWAKKWGELVGIIGLIITLILAIGVALWQFNNEIINQKKISLNEHIENIESLIEEINMDLKIIDEIFSIKEKILNKTGIYVQYQLIDLNIKERIVDGKLKNDSLKNSLIAVEFDIIQVNNIIKMANSGTIPAEERRNIMSQILSENKSKETPRSILITSEKLVNVKGFLEEYLKCLEKTQSIDSC